MVRVPLPLVPGVERIGVEVRRRVVLRRDDPGHPVIRADVEVSRVLEVIVDHAHDGPRLVVVPVVRVAQVVAVHLQRAVGLQEHLVHLSLVRPRVGPHVRVLEHRTVGVARVIADEALALRPAFDHRDVRGLGVPRPVVKPVLGGVPLEDLRPGCQQVESAVAHHPEVLRFVDGRRDRLLEQPLRRSVDGQRVRGKRSKPETADLVRIGARVRRTGVRRACVGR